MCSVNSLDDVVGAEEPTLEASDQDLRDRIEEIIDRKRSSEEGRETTLTAYNRQLMHQYCSEAVERSAAELYPALCKSIRPETGEKEACLALRGMPYHRLLHARLLIFRSYCPYSHYLPFRRCLR